MLFEALMAHPDRLEEDFARLPDHPQLLKEPWQNGQGSGKLVESRCSQKILRTTTFRFFIHPFLHSYPSKCICHRTCQNDQGEDRAQVFDHDYENLLSTEGALAMADLFFDLVHTDHPGYLPQNASLPETIL